MHSLPLSAQRPAASLWRSRRLLALASDERLVEQVRRGNEAAFEVVFERYGAAILAFCRHMLGSREEAEDAVQHTFAAAYRQLGRDARAIALKPWLYTIARNRCLSTLRARREDPAPLTQLAIDGLSEQVERRAELRELLEDLAELPAEQRSALLLAELGDLSHADVAQVLGCEAQRVKALVYRARSGLIARRDARATPCEEVREQLAILHGGSLRRSAIAHHLKACAGCRAYRQEVKRQRQLLAAALPVTPTLGLKASVLGVIGIGGGSAGGGGALVGGVGAVASTGLGGGAAKMAVVAAVAAGTIAGGEAISERAAPGKPQPPPTPAAAPERPAAPIAATRPASAPAADRAGLPRRRVALPRDGATPSPPGHTRDVPNDSALPSLASVEPTRNESGLGRPSAADHGSSPPGHADAQVAPGQARGHAVPAPKHDSAKVKTPTAQDKTPPGQSKTPPPGQDKTPPGQDKTPPGQDKTPPGQDKTPPGQSKTPPGQDKTPPGQDKTPPGQDKTPPGQSKTPPGQDQDLGPLAPQAAALR